MTWPSDILRDDAARFADDWADALPFRPAVHDGTAFHALPRPVLDLRVRGRWDFETLKVPLADGDVTAGHSRDGVEVTVRGRVGNAPPLDLLAVLEDLRAALHVGGTTAKYDFYLDHDTTAGTYRRFKLCSTVRFEYDLSDGALLDYAVVIHADDPTLYETGPA